MSAWAKMRSTLVNYLGIDRETLRKTGIKTPVGSRCSLLEYIREVFFQNGTVRQALHPCLPRIQGNRDAGTERNKHVRSY